MRNTEENARITHYIHEVLPIVAELVKIFLESNNYQIKQEGCGFDLAFSIKSGDREANFFLQNLLLEIATVDTHEEPLRFDERLRDFDYFLAKTARHAQSKLKVISQLLGEENVEAAIEDLCRNAGQFGQIQIWRIDQQKPTQGHQ